MLRRNMTSSQREVDGRPTLYVLESSRATCAQSQGESRHQRRAEDGRKWQVRPEHELEFEHFCLNLKPSKVIHRWHMKWGKNLDRDNFRTWPADPRGVVAGVEQGGEFRLDCARST